MKCKTGYKQVKGKCTKVIKRNFIKGTKKKSYNPFKMWGSYVGIIGMWGLSLMSIPQTILGKIGFNQILVIRMINESFYVWSGGFEAGVGMLVLLLFGFLIGWGIHYLIRKYKK